LVRTPVWMSVGRFTSALPIIYACQTRRPFRRTRLSPPCCAWHHQRLCHRLAACAVAEQTDCCQCLCRAGWEYPHPGAAGVSGGPHESGECLLHSGNQWTGSLQALVTNISGTVAPLPQTFARAGELLRDRCGERVRGGTVSRFVLGGRDGVPLEPGGLLLSPPVRAEHLAPVRLTDIVKGQREVSIGPVGRAGEWQHELSGTEGSACTGTMAGDAGRCMCSITLSTWEREQE
jgi:hypothetical protein